MDNFDLNELPREDELGDHENQPIEEHGAGTSYDRIRLVYLDEESGPCLSPSVADHPLGPATDHRLGKLGPDGDWPSSAKAEGSLTARPTRRAGTKFGLSDPTVP
ncbi:hypothetical protein AgCh_020057 [Apium graveolens]